MYRLLSLFLLLSVGLSAAPSTWEIDSFRKYWRGREVYLLIPRDQGDKKGLLKTTHFEFELGKPDQYERRITVLQEELFFELFQVRSVKCRPRHYEIHLSRPALPNEEVLGPRVAVVLEITAQRAISPQEANRILLTAIMSQDIFPSLLKPGEGPYSESGSAIDISQLLSSPPLRTGLDAREVERLLGTPLEVCSLKIGGQEFQYWWYFGYRRFVLLERGAVVRTCVLYF